MYVLFLINSLNIGQMRLFYKNIGLKLQALKDGSYFYGMNNCFIILRDCTGPPSRDLIVFKDSQFTKFNTESQLEDILYQEIYNKVKLYNIRDGSKKIIPIIRSSNIEYTRSLYSHLGVWAKEKHESGPVHYCFSEQELVIEIYPECKSNPRRKIELLLQGYDIDHINSNSNTITDPDLEKITFVQ